MRAIAIPEHELLPTTSKAHVCNENSWIFFRSYDLYTDFNNNDSKLLRFINMWTRTTNTSTTCQKRKCLLRNLWFKIIWIVHKFQHCGIKFLKIIIVWTLLNEYSTTPRWTSKFSLPPHNRVIVRICCSVHEIWFIFRKVSRISSICSVSSNDQRSSYYKKMTLFTTYNCVLIVRVQNSECATQKCEYWKI